MSLYALTLCCGVKLYELQGLTVGRFFLNISGTVWSNDQALHADRYYGVAGAGSQEFTTFRTGAAWQGGKVYGFLLSFRMIDFVIAFHTAAKRM